jgi:capsule polysaccharide export protein KpsE/RkpR
VGLLGPSSRVRELSNWLKDTPATAAQLRVVVRDQDRLEVLKTWASPDHAEDLADDIEGLVRAWSDEAGQSVTAFVQWVDERAECIQERRLRVKHASPDEGARAFEGNAQSVLAQTQAHQQVLMEHFVASMTYALEQMGRRTDEAYRALTSAEREIGQLKAENESLQEEILARQAESTMAAAEATNDTDPVADRMARYMDMYVASKLGGAPPRKPGGDEG